jgi:hypothetical protein
VFIDVRSGAILQARPNVDVCTVVVSPGPGILTVETSLGKNISTTIQPVYEGSYFLTIDDRTGRTLSRVYSDHECSGLVAYDASRDLGLIMVVAPYHSPQLGSGVYSVSAGQVGGFVPIFNQYPYQRTALGLDGRRGLVFLVVGNQLYVLQISGQLIGQITLPPPEYASVSGIMAVEGTGRLFIADPDLNLIFVYNTDRLAAAAAVAPTPTP